MSRPIWLPPFMTMRRMSDSFMLPSAIRHHPRFITPLKWVISREPTNTPDSPRRCYVGIGPTSWPQPGAIWIASHRDNHTLSRMLLVPDCGTITQPCVTTPLRSRAPMTLSNTRKGLPVAVLTAMLMDTHQNRLTSAKCLVPPYCIWTIRDLYPTFAQRELASSK